jgi:hypothetical protein
LAAIPSNVTSRRAAPQRRWVLSAATLASLLLDLVAVYLGEHLGWPGAYAVLVLLFTAGALVGLLALAAAKMSDAFGGTFGLFLAPTGSSTPAVPDYSYQEALVKRGQVARALESFEGIIAASPQIIDARIRAADLYAGEGKNPQRAAALFREVQRMPDVSPADDLYASNRLVDLYAGPLREPGRAIVELRRIQQRHPRSPAAAHAARGIATLKAQLTERGEREA